MIITSVGFCLLLAISTVSMVGVFIQLLRIHYRRTFKIYGDELFKQYKKQLDKQKQEYKVLEDKYNLLKERLEENEEYTYQ